MGYVFFAFCERCFFSAFQLLLFAAAARFLSVHEFAILILLLAFLTILLPVSFLGSDRIFLRDVAVRGTIQSDDLSFAALCRFTGSILAALTVILWVIGMVDISDPFGLGLFVVLRYSLHTLSVGESVLVSQKRFVEIFLVRVFSVLGACVAIGMLFIGFEGTTNSLNLFLWCYGFEALLFNCVAFFVAKRKIGLNFSFAAARFAGTRQRLVEVFYVMGAALATQTYHRLSQVIFPFVSTLDELAVYAVAARVAEISLLISGVLAQVLVANRCLLGGLFTQNRLGEDALRFSLFVGLVGALGTIAIAPIFIKVLFGSAFQASATVSQIVALGIPGAFLGGAMVGVSAAEGYTRETVKVLIITLGLAFILNTILIASFGAVGSGIAMAVTYWMPPLIFVWQVRKKNRQRTSVFLLMTPLMSPKKLSALINKIGRRA